MKFNKQQLITFTTFIGLSIVASQFDFTPFVAGRNLKFTFFDLYAPIAGSLFGGITGSIAVLAVEIANLLWRQTLTLAGFLHLFPVMFGALYFGSNRKIVNLIPVIAIASFTLHPVGREVWYFSLFWLIPILCQPFKVKSLLARSFGAVFTSHAVGGLLWIYFFNPPAAVWNSLIPIVIMERITFAVVSTVMYLIAEKIINAIFADQNARHASAER